MGDRRLVDQLAARVTVPRYCHLIQDFVKTVRPVKWDVVKERMFDGELHCSLSSRNVRMPKEETQYRQSTYIEASLQNMTSERETKQHSEPIHR